MQGTFRDLPPLLRRGRLQAGLAVWLAIAAVRTAAGSEAKDMAAGEAAATSISLEIEDGLARLSVDGAPLAEVLTAMGEAGAFRVILLGELAAPLHDSFSAQPLERAIRRLVGDRPLIMVREPAGQDGARALAEIRVTGDAAAGQTTAEPTPRPARSGPEPADQTFTGVQFGWARNRENILLELEDVEPEIRMAAVPKVASLNPGVAYRVLSEVFANDEDPLVRSRAVAAATRLNGPMRAALLKEQAMQDEDPELRMQALNALAAAQERRVTPALGQILRTDPEPEVRLTAVQALQRIGGARARSYVKMVVGDWDPELGRAAEQALASWQD